MVDIVDARDGSCVDRRVVTVGELKRESIDHMLLLDFGHGVVEELSLIPVFCELLATDTFLDTRDPLRVPVWN